MPEREVVRATALVPRPDLRGRFCPKPFDNLAIGPDATGWLCCEDWLPTSIGNVRDDGLMAVWNSPLAQAVRASILDGSYRFCNADTCPDIVQDALPLSADVEDPRWRRFLDEGITELDSGPRRIGMGYDNTCNLKCPTCRPELITLTGKARDDAARVQDDVMQVLGDVESLTITGTGDAFASPLYRRFLRTFDAEEWPNVRIALMTNGLLFTPAMWESMERAQPAVEGVSISIDAATPETYAKNRGGDFDKLLDNLAFIAQLRAEWRLRWFELSFVVQQNNYREMRDFVRLGFVLRTDSILFQRLIRWEGTMSEEAYRAAAVHLPAHPEHEAFLEVLGDAALEDPRIDLSNLSNLRVRA